MTTATTQKVEVALAQVADAQSIAAMFNAALGQGGVMAPGHEPYPDPSLFSKDGIESNIQSDERQLIIAKVDGQVSGGMVVDKLSPLHCEFNCMAVSLDKRGQRLGSRIVRGARKLVDETLFMVNCTELVTHSLMSQAAHFSEGYDRICGFSFCHYPKVFFANHPESVLWVGLLQGRLIESLQELRKNLGRKPFTTASELYQTIKASAGSLAGKGLVSDELAGSDENMQLAAEVLRTRPIYLPPDYLPLAESILIQFRDILEYNLIDDSSVGSAPSGNGKLSVNYVDGYAHSYLSYSPDFKLDKQELDTAIQSVKDKNKRFMLVRIPANEPQAIATVEHLLTQGFVFHSLLPLYGFNQDKNGKAELYDIITMQWIAPHILAENELPGETNSVVKVHGYPENLSGDILRLIRKELMAKESKQ
ncbi:MAG: GNAT family N-acetyltransferase [Candidatus Obscuribacterales bacterium]|nr:GNAT family N-acetyltransferase [Candidatus Obscuribacterales bacterium]